MKIEKPKTNRTWLSLSDNDVTRFVADVYPNERLRHIMEYQKFGLTIFGEFKSFAEAEMEIWKRPRKKNKQRSKSPITE